MPEPVGVEYKFEQELPEAVTVPCPKLHKKFTFACAGVEKLKGNPAH